TWEKIADARRFLQHDMPFRTKYPGVRWRPCKCQFVQFYLAIPAATPRRSEQRCGAESGVLAAGCPHEVPQRLDIIMAIEHINPITGLQASGQSQDLVCRQVKRV